jgi:hypothetical protein
METRIINAGMIAVCGPDYADVIPEAMRTAGRQILARRATVVSSRYGGWEVFAHSHGDAAYFAIQQAGDTLAESVAVRSGQGMSVWQDFLQHFQAHCAAGRLTDFQRQFPPPPIAPWMAVITHPAMRPFPDQQKGELGLFLLGLAHAFNEEPATPPRWPMAMRN